MWSKIKNFFKGSKCELGKLNPTKNKLVTLIDIMENLFDKYDPKLVNLIWHKKIFTPLESKKLRDDLSYLLPQIINYWVSFAPDPKRQIETTDFNQDKSGFSELILATCATDIFFANSAIFTLLSSFFPNQSKHVSSNLKIQTLVQAILLVSRKKF